MQKINIDSVSTAKVKFGIKTTLVSGKNKYIFYDTKKDGSTSKAQEQFTKFGFKTGDQVEAEVAEEQKTFVNPKGETVNYTERTIKYFREIDDLPVVESVGRVNTPPAPRTPNSGQNIAQSEPLWVARLEGKLDKMLKYIGQETNEGNPMEEKVEEDSIDPSSLPF